MSIYPSIIEGNEPVFSGNAAEKFRLIYKLGELADSIENTFCLRDFQESIRRSIPLKTISRGTLT